MKNILNRLKKKAFQSQCRYKVSAVGLNKRGEIIGWSYNTPRYSKLHGSKHAEMNLMANFQSVKSILICRVGKNGRLRRIDPCSTCQQKANELGIKISTIYE